jgi:hypothetical protein
LVCQKHIPTLDCAECDLTSVGAQKDASIPDGSRRAVALAVVEIHVPIADRSSCLIAVGVVDKNGSTLGKHRTAQQKQGRECLCSHLASLSFCYYLTAFEFAHTFKKSAKKELWSWPFKLA